MANDREHVYTPLPDPEHIRILVLHPSTSNEDPVRCDLEVTSFNAPTEYAALSYSWGMNKDGDASPNRTIDMSGRPLSITQNLFEGLKRIRCANIDVRLWVDAVCINQNDNDEKSHQVARMSEVYAKAIKTIVWLGEGESQKDDFATLDFFQKTIECHLHPEDEEDSEDDEDDQDDEDDEDDEDSEDDEDIGDGELDRSWSGGNVIDNDVWARDDGQIADIPAVVSFLSSLLSSSLSEEDTEDMLRKDQKLRDDVSHIRRLLRAFLSRRYFSRRWICQELYHSPFAKTEIKWGVCTCPITWLTGRLANLISTPLYASQEVQGCSGQDLGSHGSDVSNDTWRYMARASNIISVQDEGKDGDTRGILISAVTSLSAQECGDPRDRLFALTSMDPHFGLRPDYRLTVLEVYIAFAKRLVERGFLYMILATLEQSPEEDNWLPTETVVQHEPIHGLPSWVPDLRKRFRGLSYSHTPLMAATVDLHNFLTCKVDLCDISELNDDGDDTSDSESPGTCAPQLAAGDVSCSVCWVTDGKGAPHHLLVLCPSTQVEHTYTIVYVKSRRGNGPPLSFRSADVRII